MRFYIILSKKLKKNLATALVFSTVILATECTALATTVDTIQVDKSTLNLGTVKEAQIDNTASLKSIEEYDKEIGNINKNIESLKNLKRVYETNSESLKEDINLLNEKIKDVQNKMVALEESILKKTKSIDKIKLDLIELYKEIELMEAEKKLREDDFKGRIFSIQHSKDVSVVEVILESKSFGDMINRFTSYKEIVKADNKAIEEYLDLLDKLDKTKVETEELQKKLENELVTLNNHRVQLNSDKKEYDDLILRKERQSKSVSQIINDINADLNIMNSSISTISINKNSATVLAEIEKKVALEKANAITNSTIYRTVDLSNVENVSVKIQEEIAENKIFITPTTGRFSSGFGPRVLYGKYDYHRGIDIANSQGNPIHASAEGNVISTSQGSSYGNVIYISHNIDGIDYITVYAHLSAFGVKVGDYVEQGQVIALMGTTGNSTGSHLHFEIQPNTKKWDNSKAVDPWKYITSDLSEFNTRKNK